MAVTTTPEQNNSPFFIVGAPRSGTTLLRLMMNMHSRLCVPPESHFIPHMVKQLKDRWTIEDFWTTICAHTRFTEWNLDPESVRSRLSEGAADWRRVFTILFEQYARHVGKPRWGDKTPGYVQHLGLLEQIFPDAKFIHIIRDGRDVACSLRSVAWYQGTVADCARWWRTLVQKGRRDGRRLGKGQYIEIRYEELVNDPEGTLQAVCDLIGEQFEEEMLCYYTEAEQEIPQHRMAWHEQTTQPVNHGSVRRWERELSAADVAEFEVYAGDLLRRLGYQTQTSPSARAVGKRVVWYLARVRRSVVSRSPWKQR